MPLLLMPPSILFMLRLFIDFMVAWVCEKKRGKLGGFGRRVSSDAGEQSHRPTRRNELRWDKGVEAATRRRNG